MLSFTHNYVYSLSMKLKKIVMLFLSLYNICFHFHPLYPHSMAYIIYVSIYVRCSYVHVLDFQASTFHSEGRYSLIYTVSLAHPLQYKVKRNVLNGDGSKES